jgi:hypothetical protein
MTPAEMIFGRTRRVRAVPRVVPRPCALTCEDQAIFRRRVSSAMEASYRYEAAWDALLAASRLTTCGSNIEAVTIEVASDELRERVPA